jgi:hypothetical protein
LSWEKLNSVDADVYRIPQPRPSLERNVARAATFDVRVGSKKDALMATESEKNHGPLYLIVGILIVGVVVLAVMMLNNGGTNGGTADNAVERSADAVGDAADNVGDAARDATPGG